MRLGFLIRVTVFLILALTLGIGSARWLIARSASAVPINVGDWKTWADDDGRIANGPYGSAHYLLSGRLPPPANQIKIFETDEDDDGQRLAGDCVYTVSGPAQGARWWEIAILDPEGGRQSDSEARANSAASTQIIGNADGSFTVTIAREPKAGNWISPGELTRYTLAVSLRVARLHDTIEPAAILPRVTRGECS